MRRLLNFFFLINFAVSLTSDIDLFLLLSNIPCTCGFYIMKSEYNFSTISKAIEACVYVHLYWRKSLGYLFSFVVFYRLTLFYQIRFDYVHLLKRLLHFSIPNKFTWRKIPQTKAVFWKRHTIEITIIFIVQDFFLQKQN